MAQVVIHRMAIAEFLHLHHIELHPSRQEEQSTPDQRVSLESAFILGDRKLTPAAVNAVENVVRTELLDAIPKSLADSCVRQGYCTAELIIWYIVKQLILPPDVNEVTMKREILTPPKVPPSTLDHASK